MPMGGDLGEFVYIWVCEHLRKRNIKKIICILEIETSERDIVSGIIYNFILTKHIIGFQNLKPYPNPILQK